MTQLLPGKFVIALFAAVLIFSESTIASRPPQPQSIPDGKAGTIVFHDIGSVIVTPFLFPVAPMSPQQISHLSLNPIPLPNGGAPKQSCGVKLQPVHGVTQSISLVGTGEREALTCGHIKAFGRVPAPRGAYRIAFIYQAFGPHEEVSIPVILTRSDKNALWRIDEDLSAQIDEHGVHSVPAMRKFLAGR